MTVGKTDLATCDLDVRPRNRVVSYVHIPPLIDGLCLFAERQNQRRVFMRPLDLLVVRRRRLIEQPFCLRNYSSRKLDIQRFCHALEQFETPRPRLMIGCT